MVFTPNDPTQAEVRVSQDGAQLSFDFYIPRGAKGDPGGISNPTVIAAGTDWNNVTTSGLYYAAGSDLASQPNSPPSYAIGVNVMVQARNASVITQIAWTVSNAHSQFQLTRSLVSGTWGPWKVFRNTSIDNTAGKVITMWDESANRSQMIYGDTGWRDISMAGETQKTLIRRVGSVVELQFTNHAATAGNYVFSNSVASGFRPAITREYPYREGAAAFGSTKMMSVTNGGTVTFWNAAGGSTSAVAMWTTTEAWPTSLPGTAAGTIPNL